MGQQDKKTGGRSVRQARGRSKGVRRLTGDGFTPANGNLYIVPEPGGSLPGGTPATTHEVELPDAPLPHKRQKASKSNRAQVISFAERPQSSVPQPSTLQSSAPQSSATDEALDADEESAPALDLPVPRSDARPSARSRMRSGARPGTRPAPRSAARSAARRSDPARSDPAGARQADANGTSSRPADSGHRPAKRKVARSGATEAQQTARVNLKMRETDMRRRRRGPMSRAQRMVIAASAFAMVLLTGLIVYPPAQGLYSAVRLKEYHEHQLAVAQENNRTMQERVRTLQTQEGIQDEARSRYGLVLPGETLGTVVGSPADAADQSASADAQADQGWVSALLDGVFNVSAPTDSTGTGVDASLIADAAPNATVATEESQGQDSQTSDGQDSSVATDAAAETGADSSDTPTSASGDADEQNSTADVVVNQDADVVVDEGAGA